MQPLGEEVGRVENEKCLKKSWGSRYVARLSGKMFVLWVGSCNSTARS